MFCTADRDCRLDFVLTERLKHHLGPASAEVIGLNSTSCVTAGIVELLQSWVAKERQTVDRAEQREVGIRDCTKASGVAVRLTCPKEKSCTHV